MTNLDDAIVSLARRIVARKRQNEPPYTLLIGAGASIESDNPSWKDVCDGLSIVLKANSQQGLSKILSGATRDSSDFYAALKQILKGKQASLGYHYLAYLIAHGFFNTVFTTNWDNFLEGALVSQIHYSEFKVLARGEITDKRIIDFLKYRSPRIKIVKLHGDLEARIFDITNKDLFKISSEIIGLLKEFFSNDLIIVGHSVNDVDIQNALSEEHGVIWYVSPEKPSRNDFIIRAMDARNCQENMIITSFDKFFIDIALQIEHIQFESRTLHYAHSSKKIIEKLEKGTNYLDIHNVKESVDQLCTLINKNKFQPDLIMYIHDPDAPGGSEVIKWLERQGKFSSIKTQELKITGRYDKLADRDSHSISPIYDNITKILLIDSITFSGRTSLLAAKRIKEAYGDVLIKMAFLVVGKPFLTKLHAGEINGFTRDDIFFVEETDRMEIFFPWGYTQSTANTIRSFQGHEKEYQVLIYKRPWGNMEVFSENNYCSVRLLNIHSGYCLSLQRHVCRDEFFIPLDDNIGLQIEGERFVIEKGDYIVIPRGVWHRIFAFKNSGRVLEIAFGLYDQINDIERRLDLYGRENKDGSY